MDGFRKNVVDLMIQYDFYKVPLLSRICSQAKWENYLQNGKLTKDPPPIYIYQKFSADFIPKTLAEVGNAFLLPHKMLPLISSKDELSDFDIAALGRPF